MQYLVPVAYNPINTTRSAPINYPAAPVPPASTVISSPLPSETPSNPNVPIVTPTIHATIYGLPGAILHPIISEPIQNVLPQTLQPDSMQVLPAPLSAAPLTSLGTSSTILYVIGAILIYFLFFRSRSTGE